MAGVPGSCAAAFRLHCCIYFAKLPGNLFGGEVRRQPASGDQLGRSLSTSSPQSPAHRDDLCARARARASEKKKTPEEHTPPCLPVLPFSKISQTSSTLGQQECPKLPALLRGNHYTVENCNRPLPGPEGQESCFNYFLPEMKLGREGAVIPEGG